MNVLSISCDSVYESDYRYKVNPAKGTFMLVLAHSSIVMDIDGRSAEYPENTAAVFDGNTMAEYSAAEEHLVCDWLCFDTENESDVADTAGIVLNRPVLCADPVMIGELLRSILTEHYSLNGRRVKMTDLLLKTMLMKLGENFQRRNVPQQSADPHYSALVELREKIYRNPQTKWTVDSMAADVNMSRSYFQHIYREAFGVSCMNDVISGKIEKAKEILSETTCTVSQVAAMCGYDNEEHFMRQFKKIVGVTPTGYRKK